MCFHKIAAAAIMLPACLALTANALAQNAPGAEEATAFLGARVIAAEFAPKAQ